MNPFKFGPEEEDEEEEAPKNRTRRTPRGPSALSMWFYFASAVFTGATLAGIVLFFLVRAYLQIRYPNLK